MSNKTKWSLFLGALLVSGCGAKRYQPPRAVGLLANQHTLLAAIQLSVANAGWHLLAADERLGWVQAVTPEQNIQGVTTRERWTFLAQDHELAVAMQFEVRWDEGSPWESADVVCSGYEYLRENLFLAAVQEYANEPVILAGGETRATPPSRPQY